jgi:hypothetical protein
MCRPNKIEPFATVLPDVQALPHQLRTSDIHVKQIPLPLCGIRNDNALESVCEIEIVSRFTVLLLTERRRSERSPDHRITLIIGSPDSYS